MKLEELNFKTYVTPEQSKILQETLFKKDGKWKYGNKSICYLEYPFLYCEEGNFQVGNDVKFFIKKKLKVVNFDEAIEMIEQVEINEKDNDWVDFYIDKDGFIKDTTLEYNKNLIGDYIHGNLVIAFGGVQYIDKITWKVSAFTGHPYVCFHNGHFRKTYILGSRPIFPHKIKLWMKGK